MTPALKLFAVTLLLIGTASTDAQNYPSKILGYKLHTAKVVVSTGESAVNAEADAVVTIGSPRAVSLGLLSSDFEAPVEIFSVRHNAKIERLMFRDFRVNGLPVEIADYTSPFRVEKGTRHTFDPPMRITFNTANIARTTVKELMGAGNGWNIAGTVLVFGEFKKFGFTFKRVVPVRVQLSIVDPLR